MIKINKIAVNNNRSNNKNPLDISQADFVLDPSESSFGDGLKSMILNALPSREDKSTDLEFDGVKLPNGKRLHRPLFIVHGTVE